MKRHLLIILLCLAFSASYGQILNPIADSIPMRDNKNLAADIYLPNQTDSFPVILIMTPYGRFLYKLGLPLGIGKDIDSSKYAVVTVDWRGRFGSSAAGPQGNNGEDGYDAIDWISKQSWCNGKIGTWGPSALGRIQYATARENHPNHTCAVPLVAGMQYSYQEYFPGGAARTEYIDQLDVLGFGMSVLLYANTIYNNTWSIVESLNEYPESIETPMLLIGGWYDHNVEVMIELFEWLKMQSPDSTHHRMLFGPWVHGGSGNAYVGSSQAGELNYPAAAGWSDSLAMVFFDYWLRDIQNGWPASPNIQYFQMGDNQWQQAGKWPPSGMTNDTLYLANQSVLTTNKPSTTIGKTTTDYDPRDPSPTWGGPTLRTDQEQGPYDISDTVESRSDAAIFSTAVLSNDITVKGQIKVHLEVSSNRKDTDFAIRITDVYPDGRSMLVLDQIQRMRFRNGYTASDTAVMVPGTTYGIDISMPNTALTFKAGHKIRLVITSSNYPRFDNNLNNGSTMYVAGDTLIATNNIHHNKSEVSFVVLPVASAFTGLPDNKMNYAIKAWPNPAHESLNISLKNTDELFGLRLINMEGQTVWEKNGVNTDMNPGINISVKNLPNGVYNLMVQTSGRIITKKISIIHR